MLMRRSFATPRAMRVPAPPGSGSRSCARICCSVASWSASGGCACSSRRCVAMKSVNAWTCASSRCSAACASPRSVQSTSSAALMLVPSSNGMPAARAIASNGWSRRCANSIVRSTSRRSRSCAIRRRRNSKSAVWLNGAPSSSSSSIGVSRVPSTTCHARSVTAASAASWSESWRGRRADRAQEREDRLLLTAREDARLST